MIFIIFRFGLGAAACDGDGEHLDQTQQEPDQVYLKSYLPVVATGEAKYYNCHSYPYNYKVEESSEALIGPSKFTHITTDQHEIQPFHHRFHFTTSSSIH